MRKNKTKQEQKTPKAYLLLNPLPATYSDAFVGHDTTPPVASAPPFPPPRHTSSLPRAFFSADLNTADTGASPPLLLPPLLLDALLGVAVAPPAELGVPVVPAPFFGDEAATPEGLLSELLALPPFLEGVAPFCCRCWWCWWCWWCSVSVSASSSSSSVTPPPSAAFLVPPPAAASSSSVETSERAMVAAAAPFVEGCFGKV